MSLELTLIFIAVFAGLFALSAWRSGRPAKPGQVRMIPWTLIAIFSAAITIYLLVHLANLFGIETGQGRGRRF